MRGSDELAATLEDLIQKENLDAKIELIGSFCMAECSTGISVKLGDRQYKEVRAEETVDFFYREVLPWMGRGV
jgi:NADH:ubiquinone oxidoreductase subunit E